MLGSVAVHGGELLAAAAGAAVLLVGAAAAAGWWLRRLARRRMTALGRWSSGRLRRAAAGAAGHGSGWLWSRPLPDRGWAAAALARVRLQRAVHCAEHAVARARAAGAPVGDLDGLCERLGKAAHGADRALAINGRSGAAGPGMEPAASAADELVSIARQIQAVAAAATAAVSSPAASGLAGDVAREVVAVSAGIEAGQAVGR